MLVFTSCINNYLPKARVLAATLKSVHPDWTFCLLLGEKPPAGFNLNSEPFDRLVSFEQLSIPDYRSWLFRHRIVEVCTAAKGPALFHFLVREEHDKVMYLDPDIMVCNSLAPLEELLDTRDVLLTPHLLAPQGMEQGIDDNERCALKHGVFNLGFVAAARRGDGLRFAGWWKDRLLRYCYDDIPNGLFTDQRWCDLAPAFFSGLHIVRDPGCNAASWNLTDRVITRDSDGTFLANGQPLRFYHFTGFDSGAGDVMTGLYAKDMPAVRELWERYREHLAGSGQEAQGKQPWEHAAFACGTPVTDAMRLLYRARMDLQRSFPDPFVRPGYLDWYLAEHQAELPLRVRVRRRLGALGHKVKTVLAQHGGFPAGLPGLMRQTVDWVRKWGVRGVARRIWRIADRGVHAPADALPVLHDILEKQEAPAFVRLAALLDPDRLPVCVIEHAWGGGADAYCQKRIRALLEGGRAVIRLRYEPRERRIVMTALWGSDSFRCEVASLRDLTHSRFPRIAAILVNEFAGWYDWFDAPESLLPFPESIGKIQDAVRAVAGIARHHGAHLEVVFHDFFAVCPTVILLTPEQKFCGLTKPVEACDACALHGQPVSMVAWRKAWSELLERADELVFFSENTRRMVCSVYPLREEQIRVQPHSLTPLGERLAIPTDGPMRIAVVGDIQLHKGSRIICRLAALLKTTRPDVSIVIFGGLEAPSIPDNVIVLGTYKLETLPALLRTYRVTAGLFPSICPETFSYVVHELGELGLPLVAFDLGVQGEYVRSLPNSRVAKEVSAAAALDALLELDARRISPPSA